MEQKVGPAAVPGSAGEQRRGAEVVVTLGVVSVVATAKIKNVILIFPQCCVRTKACFSFGTELFYAHSGGDRASTPRGGGAAKG